MAISIYNNSKWYFSLIECAKSCNRIKGETIYYESHHIIPKSMDGDNTSNNLVLLTPREHFICHLLLPKMCVNPDHKRRMVYAFMLISKAGNPINQQYYYNSRHYELFKNAYIKLISGKNCYMYGVPKSDEIKQKISATRIKEKTASGENNPMYGKTHTENSKQKMSQNSKGKTLGSKNGMYGGRRKDLSQYNKEHNVRYRVGQYDKDMNLIVIHEHSAKAAESINAKNHRNINYLAKNYNKYPNRTAYGFKWRYIV